MNHFKNFTEYKGEDLRAKYPPKVIILVDEDGNDWYDVMETFADNTAAVAYQRDGRITGYTEGSPSGSLWPVNSSVLEVAELPEGFEHQDYLVVADKLVKLAQ